jgi:hypothetical protein
VESQRSVRTRVEGEYETKCRVQRRANDKFEARQLLSNGGTLQPVGKNVA